MKHSKRLTRLILGLTLCSISIYINVQANIGLSPWDTLNMGVSKTLSISLGSSSILISMIILALDILLREKIGIGTLLNIYIIGKLLDLWIYLDIIPMQDSLIIGMILNIISQFILAIGSYFYIGASYGCGPRDSFTVGINKRFPKASIGAVKSIIEGIVLIIGYLMGAKIGIGTVMFVLGIGYFMNFVFNNRGLEVKDIKHEDLLYTFRNISISLPFKTSNKSK